MKNQNNYPGQKKIPGVYQKIINNIPLHSIYYEPFAGSAQIAKILYNSSKDSTYYLNDIDPAVNSLLSLLEGSTITNVNAFDVLQSEILLSSGKETFIFIDPPYLHSSRPNNQTLYNYEFSNENHYQLIKSLLQLNCNCMIIHPSCELYDLHLSSWRIIQIKIRYHSKTSIENLYMNYDIPEKLQCVDFVGSNCWDRQRIKRKADRLMSKISLLPAHEQQYIFSKLSTINRF